MRFTIPDDKKLVHEMVFPIRWGDMDAMGHVNNSVYFRYLEMVRLDWFRVLDILPNPQGEGPVIVNAFCNFYRQLEYPGDVLARHYVRNPGRSSFDTYVTLERVDRPGEIDAAGGAKIVWVDFPKQKSAAMPDWLRERVSS
ncbi:MAG: acyl-CoA thioesterase [Burkholderiales bacterium]|jgi:acyl-CoA thioester hydrolase|nr:acyl-CoA thioesterase [Burkholderiales bacterium]MBP6250310.1 acyl-CoA thioesterase [Leptothrix sp. (in: b-proteobacteria)]MBP7521806.1 acyl-CoA thioesterase [Leptothrix sp. (in: b-proteobacteria)]HQY08256.1 thioesterase family protein [Burkholderiaceae bacterium]